MIKTMKVKKQLRLDELIKYVWENGIDNENYYSDLGNHVSVGVQSLLWTNSTISKNDTFTVEVEEEITKDTRMAKIVILTKDGVIHRSWNDSINGLKIAYPDALQIHAIVNGKLQLIWEAE